MFNRIIVGCDGRDESFDALSLGVMLAGISGASLILAHVYEQQPHWYATLRAYERDRREHSLSILTPAVEMLPQSIRYQAMAIGSASPARGLHELADGERADLVVIGSTHRGRVGRILPGSVAEVMLSGGPCAVLVAPRGYRDRENERIASIGVGYDGSTEGGLTLAGADRLATSLDASLHAIAVAPRHRVRADERDRDLLRERLEDALRALGRSPETEGRVLTGEPATALAHAAHDFDLMVAGSRGYGPVRHVLLGSVSAPLMRSCPSPLLVLPRSSAAGDSNPAETVAAAAR